jgi:hypothetical protein
MEIKDMKMEDITKRMSEIVELLKSDDCDVDALTEETNKLEARKQEIEANAKKQKDLLDAIARGAKGTVIEEHKETVQKEDKKVSEAEERANEFKKTGRMEIRAILATGKIATPVKAEGVNGLPEAAGSIVDDVAAVMANGIGSYRVAYKKTEAAAADVTDGSAVGGTPSTFDYVDIAPVEWGILDEISHMAASLTNVDYQMAIEQAAVNGLRAEAEAKIVAAVKASTLAEKKASVALDQDYLKTLALGFKANRNLGAEKLYLCRADLITLGKIRGTNEKKALYEITFSDNTGMNGMITEGGLAIPFSVTDQLTTGTQLFGQPMSIKMPMWGNYTVSTDEGGDYFKRNMIGIRGLQVAGVDLAAYHGMQVVTQAA